MVLLALAVVTAVITGGAFGVPYLLRQAQVTPAALTGWFAPYVDVTTTRQQDFVTETGAPESEVVLAFVNHNWGNFAFAVVNAVCASWAILAYIGIRNSIIDLWIGLTDWMWVEKKPKRVRQAAAVAAPADGCASAATGSAAAPTTGGSAAGSAAGAPPRSPRRRTRRATAGRSATPRSRGRASAGACNPAARRHPGRPHDGAAGAVNCCAGG
ncbi:hypothetical protein CJ026_025775 [Ralstonia pickettii]|uniref:hypothetical protein n=1 Tax=Ralstonia pickettii TaxID=329 RepID=UPI000D261AA7|nr:hypothetical protein CJ026_025775 [Ralstonia pickettii]